MASLLGSKYCIESLRGDVADLQSAVVDVLSRVGPSASFRSWKYPDKMSADLDVTQLLETYDYSDDEEERQIAHIVLMELVIDRLILLLQVMGKFVDLSTSKTGVVSATTSTHTSVGPIVKKYWNRLVQLCTMFRQTQSEVKMKSRRISELESSLSKVSNGVAPSDTFLIASTPNTSPGHQSLASRRTSLTIAPASPGRDEYNKATQTVETAFVPCESCHFVQNSLRAAGDSLVEMCRSIGIRSCLADFRVTVANISWMSANDVARWAAKQSQDLASVGSRIDLLTSTIEPLKADLEAERKKNKDAAGRLAASTKEAALERETSASMRKQYERKLKELENAKLAVVGEVDRQRSELVATRSTLERQVTDLQDELSRNKNRLRDLEQSKLELLREMEARAANSEQVQRLKTDLDGLNSELQEVSSKLREAAVELNKEKTKNKSVNQHTNSIQSKQETLLQRLDELDRDNEELRSQVADLEEARDQLSEEVNKITAERNRLLRTIKDKETAVSNTSFSEQKAKMEATIAQLRNDIKQLEDQLSEAKEKERLLVEYPDLHYTASGNSVAGTGDLAQDMENQIQANALRIQVLERENSKLRNSIDKMLRVGGGAMVNRSEKPSGKPSVAVASATDINSPPVQLWNMKTHNRGEVTVGRGLGAVRGVSHNSPDTDTRGHGDGGRTSSRQNHNDSHGVRQHSASRRGGQGTNHDDGWDESLTCPKCDKVYQSKRDLAVHKSYCSG